MTVRPDEIRRPAPPPKPLTTTLADLVRAAQKKGKK
jgi:hypothetical protein